MKSDFSGFNFDTTYTDLPQRFWVRVEPTPAAAPRIILWNAALAEEIGLASDVLQSGTGAGYFSGSSLPPGAASIAQAYAGHQYGNFTMLGDGRALLLGEQRTPGNGRVDIQLKGSGPTPFSRRGDGRAALGPMLREYILSEAMAALGIPTTRSLAVTATGEQIHRETPQPGAVLTRTAAGHIRVGTFEYAIAMGDAADVKALADYTIQRHFPETAPGDYPALLEAAAERQAALVARWMGVGFIHGVMNTDNMSIAGETIDYGPCAFLDEYDPAAVFSSIDHSGRYAFGNQPWIAQWNLARFAESLLPLIHADQQQAIEAAGEVLNRFPGMYEGYRLQEMRQKIGLSAEMDGDLELADGLLAWMERKNADFTNTFLDLTLAGPDRIPPGYDDPEFAAWHRTWRKRLQKEPAQSVGRLMRSHNPVVIPRNHRVESALRKAVEENDLSGVQDLLRVLAKPYEDNPEYSAYREPPRESERVLRTYCGT
ncbi:MAG: protein adenylyltransferase SelO [Spirochaeta sp.]